MDTAPKRDRLETVVDLGDVASWSVRRGWVSASNRKGAPAAGVDTVACAERGCASLSGPLLP